MMEGKSDRNPSPGGGHGGDVTQLATASADLLATIRDLYQVRKSLLRAEGDMVRRIKAKERSAATYRLRAQGVEPEDGKMPTPTAADRAIVLKLYPAFFEALTVLGGQRKSEEKALAIEAARLPVVAWTSKVKGLGMLSVATLTAEAVDPSRYSNPAKLWKRYGLAVIDGRSQRRVTGTEEAGRQGYDPDRRSALFIIGANLIRVKNPYARALYGAQKAKEVAKGVTKGHAHLRALRYVQKRLALAFWLAWRQIERGETLSGVPILFMNGQYSGEAARIIEAGFPISGPVTNEKEINPAAGSVVADGF